MVKPDLTEHLTNVSPAIKRPSQLTPVNTYYRKPGKRRIWRYGVAGCLLGLLIIGISGFFTAQSVQIYARSGANHLQIALEPLKDSNSRLDSAALTGTRHHLAAAMLDFRSAQIALGPFGLILPLVSWWPGVGYDLANLNGLLVLAEKSTQAGVLTLEGIEPAVNILTSSGTATSGKLLTVVNALNEPTTQGRLIEATALLDEVDRLRRSLDRSRLGLEQTQQAFDQLDRYLPALRDGLSVAQELVPLLPQALGQNHPVNYLLLLQNSDELRATGGFISAVGLLKLDKGYLSPVTFMDSYAVDNPKVGLQLPPEALSRYMYAGNFLLRDANWWPDFPTSARRVAELYRLHQAKSVDSVVALDNRAVAYIFEALGALDLPNYNERLTAQNFEERLRYYYLPPNTEKTDDWWLKRKEFMGVTMNGLLNRLNSAGIREYLALVNWLGRAMREKHLQFYFNQAELQKQLYQHGLDGSQVNLESTSKYLNDYLMVVDSNVGFNKVNPNIERSINYRVSSHAEGANLYASLTITYTNRAGVREGTSADECVKVAKYDSTYASMMNGCYWNYLRIYVPAGSQLREVIGFEANNYPQLIAENKKAVFATQIVVAPGKSVSLTVNYSLPFIISSGTEYHLTVQSQSGNKFVPLTVNLNLAGLKREWFTILDVERYFNIQKMLFSLINIT